jgi:hypothetical protein
VYFFGIAKVRSDAAASVVSATIRTLNQRRRRMSRYSRGSTEVLLVSRLGLTHPAMLVMDPQANRIGTYPAPAAS